MEPDETLDRVIRAIFGEDPPPLDRKSLWATVGALPPSRRDLLVEFFNEGLSVTEMASIGEVKQARETSTPMGGHAIVRPHRRHSPPGIVGQINAALRMLLSPGRLVGYLRRSDTPDSAAEDLARAADDALIDTGWVTERAGLTVLGSRGAEQLAAEPAAGRTFGVEIAIAELLRRPTEIRRTLVAGSDQGSWSGLRADLLIGSPWLGRHRLEIITVWPDGRARRTALKSTAWWQGQGDG